MSGPGRNPFRRTGKSYGHRQIGDDILDLTPRRYTKVDTHGTNWICKCKRRHRIPHEARADFVCPVCEDKYNG